MFFLYPWNAVHTLKLYTGPQKTLNPCMGKICLFYSGSFQDFLCLWFSIIKGRFLSVGFCLLILVLNSVVLWQFWKDLGQYSNIPGPSIFSFWYSSCTLQLKIVPQFLDFLKFSLGSFYCLYSGSLTIFLPIFSLLMSLKNS